MAVGGGELANAAPVGGAVVAAAIGFHAGVVCVFGVKAGGDRVGGSLLHHFGVGAGSEAGIFAVLERVSCGIVWTFPREGGCAGAHIAGGKVRGLKAGGQFFAENELRIVAIVGGIRT